MPLLKKRKFERAPLPDNLREDEEVFYCAITNEIFRDYEEFSERMFLCNSMVWTCCMTGKANLTYSEAVESEENARESLKEFPSELKIPILYLASKTRRTGYIDASEDVFLFAKDRYFIGENVETSFTGTKWKDSHILQVIAPTDEQVKNGPKNGSTGHFHPPASLFKYEIEHMDAHDQDISEIMIVDYSQIRRKRGFFSRERNRMFLKQYLEQDERGILVIKKSAVDSFGLSKVSFEQIFDGPPPEFDASKRFEKYANGKKTKQGSLHKFLTKNPPNENGFTGTTNNVELLEKMRKLEEDYKMRKQQKKEEILAMKQKKKEDSLVLAGRVRDWHKPKEDLELVDQKKLPVAAPVKTNIPDQYFGDVLMILEFVRSFSKLLDAKAFFSGGLNMEIMEKALTTNKVDGPLSDIIQMFLEALFNSQDEETAQYRTEVDYMAATRPCLPSNNTSLQKATYLATAASCWSGKHQGVPLGQLTLHSMSISEILRLHFLGSGARLNDTGARWRYAQRGGYTSEDDPGLAFRLNHPHILKILALRNVVELSMGDKLKILACLSDQLLTYADVRDIVEDRLEKVRQAKLDLRMEQATERRREQEFLAARIKLKKEVKDNELMAEEMRKLEEESEQKKAENEQKINKLIKASHEHQILMGQDRAFRRYWKLDSIPGLFVDGEEANPGTCLSSAVEQNPDLVDASRDQILAYLKKTLEESSSSDKENSSPKSPKKMNGARTSLVQRESCENLMMCSADPDSCVVHSKRAENPNWSFFHATEDIEELLNSLNKRGYRESELQQTLSHIIHKINYAVDNTPVNQLNAEIESAEREERRRGIGKSNKSLEDNFGYPVDLSVNEVSHYVLADYLLELEKKIHTGNLGCLVGMDRRKWRNCFSKKNYEDFDRTITKRDNSKKNGNHVADSVEPPPVTDSQYHDPGELLPAVDIDSEASPVDKDLLTLTEDVSDVIKCLAIALVQLAYAVEPKYLAMPLGSISVSKNDKKKTPRLDMWEQSLLAATSFSQIFLHYTTLDSCILWKKSTMLARCVICRKADDSENMLLCDECDNGHHLYCLRPPLKSVPEGDWFCKKCDRDKHHVDVKVKRRPIFRDEEEDEEDEGEEDEASDEGAELSNGSEDEEMDDEEEPLDSQHSAKVDLCRTCGSGGETIHCDKCSSNYHIECVEPPLRRLPRGTWCCSSCKRKNFEKRYYNGGAVVIQRTGLANGRRHCAAKALYKIHNFAKSLQQSESEESDLSEVHKRPSRRDEVRSDLPLHNSALHELLADVMKDNNAWPFLRPVVKNEVPDYYDVITKPMDFGTIKYKLNMGEYKEDANLMSDAVLVFQNCNTYNHTDDDVFKCGVELLKLFKKKCRDLGLKLPEEMDYDDNTSERPKKKRRTK